MPRLLRLLRVRSRESRCPHRGSGGDLRLGQRQIRQGENTDEHVRRTCEDGRRRSRGDSCSAGHRGQPAGCDRGRSSTSIGWRYGTQFAEPFNTRDIKKNIFNLTHVSGYTCGTNFFNVDALFSDGADPKNARSSEGTQEAYIVYRHTFDLNKITGADLKFGPVRGVGFTLGFDVNAKNDVGYNSARRMIVAGPTLKFNVSGFLDVSLLQLWESNAPCNTSNTPTSCVARYSYDPHPMLSVVWGIPVGSLPLSFEGYANFIAAKGRNEFGAETAAETNIDMMLMLDVGAATGYRKGVFKVGLEYQYWKNKFGNNASGLAGSGAFAKTPMIRAQYCF